ncbi:MAG: SLBB domain-containing protein, partial [Limnochordia bacterium]|nr:SLBB domain-containing protein [Limnochordia bacterium]
MKRLRKGAATSILLLVIIMWIIPVGASEYLLGVGDVLRITVWGHTELTTEVTVRPDGYVTFPLVGDRWAVDKTPRQLGAEIQTVLGEFVINPQVTVIVSKFRTLQVQVLGEVHSSGYYQLKAGSRLTDVLALAGGPSKTADLSSVTITRYVFDAVGQEETQVLSVDINKFLETGHLSHNPLIESTDMIFVPTSGRATIFGEVRQPTSYDLAKGLDVLDLLALAGGALDSADLASVVITSQSAGEPQDRRINVEDYMAGRSKPMEIRPNDVVFVPKKQQVMVLGAVRTPGMYTLHREAHLIDILAQAGGVLPSGDSSAVAITRKGETDQTMMLVNAEPGLKGQTGGENPRLFADDLVFVPDGYQNALVLGQVRTPGSYRVQEHTRLLDLLAEAGGATERAGDELTLTRDGNATIIDLGALERLGLQNGKVLPGDVLYVAEGRRQVLVLGEVRSPGYYQFRSGDRLLDAIGLAGGLTAVALEEQVSLSRQSSDTTDITMVDFRELMSNRYLSENLPLQGGDVIIVPRADRGVIVWGEVNRPGYYQVESGKGLLDAIMLAGGFSASAQEEKVSLTRQTADGPSIETIDFSLLMDDGYLAEDRPLQGGDVILVPKADRGVIVLGEVNRPGHYQFESGDGLLDAIMLAGGFSESAQEEEVSLTRQTANGPGIETVDFSLLMDDRYLMEDRPLQGGDVIMVPRSDRSVLVLGEVRSPGYYVFSKGQSLMDMVGRAGGFTAEAEPAKVVVSRQTEDGVHTETLNLDLRTGAEGNRALVGGEIISVPESSRMVLVFGDVVRAGAYTLPQNGRLLDVLALAGGLQSNLGTEQVVVTRQDGTAEQIWQVDYSSLMMAQGEHNLP